jgi:hypothetical protein
MTEAGEDDAERICVECGNDLVCEGFDYCSECLEGGASE